MKPSQLYKLQQYLPFTVLKLEPLIASVDVPSTLVATVLTVYGIETCATSDSSMAPVTVATVLTVYGIETKFGSLSSSWYVSSVATVLTVYGIETIIYIRYSFYIRDILWLQQYLPFTVLKPIATNCFFIIFSFPLQQYLPFTVLKPEAMFCSRILKTLSCNSTYRLRY